jgi:hypothetical protein
MLKETRQIKHKEFRQNLEEIHDVAREMLKLIKELPGNPFEHTLTAWGY